MKDPSLSAPLPVVAAPSVLSDRSLVLYVTPSTVTATFPDANHGMPLTVDAAACTVQRVFRKEKKKSKSNPRAACGAAAAAAADHTHTWIKN